MGRRGWAAPHGDPPPAYLVLQKENEELKTKLAVLRETLHVWDTAYAGQRSGRALGRMMDDLDMRLGEEW